MREVDASEHTLALLEIIRERRQKENKIEKVFFYTSLFYDDDADHLFDKP